MNRKPFSFLILSAFVLFVFFAQPAVLTHAATASEEAQYRDKVGQLVDGLQQKVSELNAYHRMQPDLGIDRLAVDLQNRIDALKKADIAAGWTWTDGATAYVGYGNTVHVTSNFFSDRYDDAARQAILLHEAVHLQQGFFQRKLEFFSGGAEIEAYTDEYKWLVVLGAEGFERENVLQALGDEYRVIPGKDVPAFEDRLGLSADLVKAIGGASAATASESLAAQSHENDFYAFSLPADWGVEYGDPQSAQVGYVFMNKVVKRSPTAELGVRLTLGVVHGADYLDPGIVRLRDDEMAKDKKWDFSGGKDQRKFEPLNRSVGGQTSEGYRRTVVSQNGDESKTTMIMEKLYFKKDRRYYFTEFNYNADFRHATLRDYATFLDTLVLK